MSELRDIEIQVGHQVEDIVTGVKGTVTSITFYMSGTVQAIVTPKTDDPNKMPDSWAIDVEQLKVIENGEHVLDKVTPAGAPLVALGAQVKDVMTGFKGKVFALTICFNGCIRALVVADVKAKQPLTIDGRPPEINVDHKHLEVVGAGVSKTSAKPAPVGKTGFSHSKIAAKPHRQQAR